MSDKLLALGFFATVLGVCLLLLPPPGALLITGVILSAFSTLFKMAEQGDRILRERRERKASKLR